MRLLPLFLFAACGGSSTPEGPESFGDFYAELQDQLCPLAVDDCASSAEILDCEDRTTVPACDDYDPLMAGICLDEEATCAGSVLATTTRACDVVCENGLNAFSPPVPASCREMLICDAAYADALDVTRSFDGLDDPNYGIGGTCFQGDPDACAAACASAVDGYKTGLQAAVDAGTISSMPSDCN